MPVSKEEVVKALHLLKELLIEAESRQDISDDSSVIEPLVETSDILGSNLFTRLVNIQNTLGKTEWSGGIVLSSQDNSELLSDDTRCSNDMNPSKQDEINMEEILEEELSPAHILPSLNHTPPRQNHMLRHEQTTEHDLVTRSPLATVTQSLTTKSNSGNNFTDINIEHLKLTNCRDKNERAMKDSPSSVKYLVPKQEIEEIDNGGKTGLIDMLSPLRNEKSLSDIKQALHGKHGRDPRSVNLTQTSEGLGIEFVGLSRTGIFISSLSIDGVAAMCGLLQVGDQILEVNGASSDNLASFEVAHQIEEIPIDEQITLTVVYNPTDLIK